MQSPLWELSAGELSQSLLRGVEWGRGKVLQEECSPVAVTQKK